MTDLPEPLTPADCDVRHLRGFMFDTEKLMASELWALSSGEEFKAAFGLWCRAWKQVPAASLPDDDKILSAFSGAGVKWKKIKEMALRGFIKCNDGRLYHAVLAEDAINAHNKTQIYRERAIKGGNARAALSSQQAQLQASLKLATSSPQVELDASLNQPRDRDSTIDSSLRSESDAQEGEDEKSQKKPRSKRGSRIPDDWQPSREDREFSQSLGLDPQRIRDEFVDYWRGESRASAVKLDWSATWRNRCRAIAERQGIGGYSTSRRSAGNGSNPVGIVAALRDSLGGDDGYPGFNNEPEPT